MAGAPSINIPKIRSTILSKIRKEMRLEIIPEKEGSQDLWGIEHGQDPAESSCKSEQCTKRRAGVDRLQHKSPQLL